jgi:hypothetical protein
MVLHMASAEAAGSLLDSNGSSHGLAGGAYVTGSLPWLCQHDHFDVNPSAVLRRVHAIHRYSNPRRRAL